MRDQQLRRHCMFFNSQKTMEDSDNRPTSPDDNDEEVDEVSDV